MDDETAASASTIPSSLLLTPNSKKIEVKLFINKEEQKVLYAEAGKEFVDFLFSIVSSPLGQVIKVLQNHKISEMQQLGSLANLYNSITTLNKTYLIDIESSSSSENLDSDSIDLNHQEVPSPKQQLAFESLLLSLTKNTTTGTTTIDDLVALTKRNDRVLYMCTACYGIQRYVATEPNSLCPNCKKKMTRQLKFVDRKESSTIRSSSGSSGFVKGLVPYMVMDNLEVKPLSTISTLALLHSSGIQDPTSIQEMVVHVGAAEGLKLLEESMKSKNVLTSVFLAKRSKRRI